MMNIKTTTFIFSTLLLSAFLSTSCNAQEKGLKDVAKDKFLIGAAVNVNQVKGKDPKCIELLDKHFNSIVAENCMKSEEIHPQENVYNFTEADEFVNFGKKHNMTIIGHCLVWHSQLAKWFCVDKDGKNVSADVLKKRLKDHITTIVTRYKGQIKGWDVVNEAIESDGSWRNSKFYQILGEEFIPLAFQYAHEADPDAELYYNDYGMSDKGRRDSVVKLVKMLKDRGLRIDGVGMQCHVGLDYPEITEFQKSVDAFKAAGVKIMITEMDMSALPTINRGANVADKVEFEKKLNPYPKGLPEEVSEQWNNRMTEFFNLFFKNADVITRVTAWGVIDSDSWKNNWPMRGRIDYPLLFERNYEPKPFVKDLINK